MVQIRRAGPGDAGVIRQIAAEVWPVAYTSIIGREQVAYMLELFYNAAIIEQQIKTGEQAYILPEEEGRPVGFAAYSPRPENTSIFKLHKLYCISTLHGKGYGRMLLEAVEKEVLAAGAGRLELNVNRHNPARGFYEKLGYTIAYEEDIDIGDGYWMNDYVMGKDL